VMCDANVRGSLCPLPYKCAFHTNKHLGLVPYGVQERGVRLVQCAVCINL